MAKWYKPSTWRKGYWASTNVTYVELIELIISAKTLRELRLYEKYLKEFRKP